MTPSTSSYSQSVSPFSSVIDPTLGLEQAPTTKWLEDCIPSLPKLPNKPISTSTSSPYSTPDNLASGSTGDQESGRTPYETQLLSSLPPKETLDGLISVYFARSDACLVTFCPTFYKSYHRLWETPSDKPVNVPFLGVLFSAIANAVHSNAEEEGTNSDKSRASMDLYDRLSNQITDDPRYNFHIETVEAVLLQAMFLLNDVPLLQDVIDDRVK